MEHTQGKWNVGTWEDTNGHCGWSIETECKNIATVYAGIIVAPRKRGDMYKHPENKESIANARLIAAAPELLEACKELLSVMPQVLSANAEWNIANTLDKARATIAKAEGKSDK